MTTQPDGVTTGSRPVVVVVGLGPAGVDLLSERTRSRIDSADAVFLRTARHPAAAAFGDAATFDHHYERAETFEEVYAAIVDDLVTAAAGGGSVVYAVPGSPLVAERTVELLRADPRIDVHIEPALSFLDLAWAALGVDPVAAGVRLVDGARFAAEAAGERGPLLVAQCWSAEVLSDIKLAVDPADADESAEPLSVTLLHHLGLADERIETVGWDDLDRTIGPDHLTSVWIPRLAAPIGRRMADLVELVRTLRERCPWDREQTHASLSRHALEEAYEVVDAIAEVARFDDAPARVAGDDAAAVAHLEEELGDLLFQVVFHARLATEEGRFTLADVARAVHDKLVARHPHVFGDGTAATPDAVVANWEVLKVAERGRSGITDGIPSALPALSLVGKLERKARAIGFDQPSFDEARRALAADLESLASPGADAPASRESAERLGSMLFSTAQLCGRLGVDPEEVLRRRALALRDEIERRASDAAPFPEFGGSTG